MRPMIPLILLGCALLFIAAPASGAVTLTINASESSPRIGDTVLLSGTVNGTPTIAVFLFLTGPGLDSRGVALDNLNIPAGRGMFTSAPVQMANGTWTYVWDTSVILGTLQPGTYTVYVLDNPVDRQRFLKADYATTEIVFLPADVTPAPTPLDPVIPVAGLIGAGCLAGILRQRKP